MESPIHPRHPRRQAFLFLIAILVPCLVLVALGWRLMAQERQLEDQRRVEARQLLVVGAALSEEAKRGLQVFRGKANCTACHVGPLLSDEEFHNTGVAWKAGGLTDPGRFGVTAQDADRGAFKTPTLREVARTAPFMHDGSLATLDEVIDYYDRGGNANAHLDPEIRPLTLTADERRALVAFLASLSGKVYEGAR